MHHHRYTVNSRALLGYTSLKGKERKALVSALNTLAELPENKWDSAGAIRLGSPEPLYLLRLGDSLRVIVQPTSGGQPELNDLFRRETVERFFKGNPNGASPE